MPETTMSEAEILSGLPLSQQELDVVTGWIIGVYAALAYLTFVYDWSKEGATGRAAEGLA